MKKIHPWLAVCTRTVLRLFWPRTLQPARFSGTAGGLYQSADISTLLDAEKHGRRSTIQNNQRRDGIYSEENGVNYVRLRLWVPDPQSRRAARLWRRE